MIHTARQSPKFIKLIRRLRQHVPPDSFMSEESVAIAILERLWHATASGAIRGDIGKFDNDVIAEACGWKGDADALVEILVDCRWLDRCDEHRLLIHDWHIHAPKHVKGNVKKVGGFFAEGPAPKARPKGDAPKAQPQGIGPPNLTKPNLTKEDTNVSLSTAVDTPSPQERIDEAWKNAKGVSGFRDWTKKRQTALRERVKTQVAGKPWLVVAIYVLESKFPLKCFSEPGGFVPNIDWFLRPDTVTRILEGRMDFTPRGSPDGKPKRESASKLMGLET